MPRQPQDLASHRWIALSLLRSPLTWAFTSRSGARRAVRMQSVARCSSPMAVQELLREGMGVSVLTDYMARDDIQQGRLVRLLADWQLPKGGIHAVYPDTRHVPAKVRALVDFLKDGETGRRPREH